MLSNQIKLNYSKNLMSLTQSLHHKSTSKTIHLITKNLFTHDATSRCVIEQLNILETAGHKVFLYAENTSEEFQKFVSSKKEILKKCDKGDYILLHFSIEDPFLEDICKAKAKKIVYYHGITPPKFLTDNSFVQKECIQGLKQLELFSNFDYYLSNSEFCLNELMLHSGNRVKRKIIPPSISASKWQFIHEDQKFKQKNIYPKFLYIGRKFPHKNIKGLLNFFDLFLGIHKKGQLIIAGAGYDSDYYLPLKDKYSKDPFYIDKIYFYETLSDEQLKQLYLETDFVVTFSEHEGFCVPILEASVFDKIVITHKCTALTETSKLANSIIVNYKDYQEAANLASSYCNKKFKLCSPRKEYSDTFYINEFLQIFDQI